MTIPPIMAPCPGGCGVVLPTVLVACSACLTGIPDDLWYRWASADPGTNVTGYLDARKAVREWLKQQAEDRRLDEAHRVIGAVL